MYEAKSVAGPLLDLTSNIANACTRDKSANLKAAQYPQALAMGNPAKRLHFRSRHAVACAPSAGSVCRISTNPALATGKAEVQLLP